MRLSREEFWILDVTTQLNFSLHLHTLNSRNADLLFNKRKHHGLSCMELIDLLVFMQKQGDLAVYRDSKDRFPEFDAYDNQLPHAPGVRVVIDYTPIWENPVFYSKKAIVADFYEAEQYDLRNPDISSREPMPQTMLCFCATPQGAAKWEETAQVDWSKYLDFEGFCNDPEDADLAENQSLMTYRAAAVSKQTLDTYFDWRIQGDNYPYSWETSSFKRFHTDRIAPWKATYWKTFPEGFECDFTEFIVRRQQRNMKEQKIAAPFEAEHRIQYCALFDWCNHYVENFPFAGE